MSVRFNLIAISIGASPLYNKLIKKRKNEQKKKEKQTHCLIINDWLCFESIFEPNSNVLIELRSEERFHQVYSIEIRK